MELFFEEYRLQIVFGIFTATCAGGFLYLIHSPQKVVDSPKIIFYRLERIFQFCCFLLASYSITKFSAQYAENRDTTFISMKTFNGEKIDNYPTFTLCFQGDRFHWYHEENIFDLYSLNASQYQRMLKGELEINKEWSKTYRVSDKNSAVPKYHSNGYFDLFHLRVADFLHELRYITEDRTGNMYFLNDKKSNETPGLYIHLSYQTADKICFTRNNDDALKSIRTHDLITFKSSIIGNKTYNKDAEIQVFIHSPNQLIRSFDKPKYKSSLSLFTSSLSKRKKLGSTVKDTNILEFKISQVKQMRRRPDSSVPCNDNSDNDKYHQQQIVKAIGCIPPYWKDSLPNDGHLEYCTTRQNLKNAFRTINDPKGIPALKDVPCNEMNLLSIDSVNHEPSPKPNDISMQFFYLEKTYEEIRYYKMMEFESWLSNVGGFIGIFLGYSLMQIPEFLVYTIGYFRKKKYSFCKNIWVKFTGCTKDRKPIVEQRGNENQFTQEEKDERWAVAARRNNHPTLVENIEPIDMIGGECSLDALPKGVTIKHKSESTSIMLGLSTTDAEEYPCRTQLSSTIPNHIHKEKEKYGNELLNTAIKDIVMMQEDILSIKREFDDFKIKQNDSIQGIRTELSRLTKSFTRVYGKKF